MKGDSASRWIRRGTDGLPFREQVRTGSMQLCVLRLLRGSDVSEAFRRAGVKNRLLVAMDTDQPVLQGVKDGTIDSTIAQKAVHDGSGWV